MLKNFFLNYLNYLTIKNKKLKRLSKTNIQIQSVKFSFDKPHPSMREQQIQKLNNKSKTN